MAVASHEEWFADALPIVAARVRAVLRGHYDSELAKDMTQAVLAHVWEVRGSYRGDGPRGAWVFQVAKNEALRIAMGEARIRVKTVRVESQGPDNDSSPGDGYDRLLADSYREQAYALTEQERLADIPKLAKLSEIMLFELLQECRTCKHAQDILVAANELRWLELSGSLKTELQLRLDLKGNAYQTALQGIQRAADRLADRHADPNYVNLFRVMMFGLEEEEVAEARP